MSLSAAVAISLPQSVLVGNEVVESVQCSTTSPTSKSNMVKGSQVGMSSADGVFDVAFLPPPPVEIQPAIVADDHHWLIWTIAVVPYMERFISV
ncbi:hypothetical protein RB195_010841 [Necator americanus]|uniref:Uncharacterized protein n=1 Tax=Necator americanus TaxID=51031 RepID=A0ABR1D0R4_NECAM